MHWSAVIALLLSVCLELCMPFLAVCQKLLYPVPKKLANMHDVLEGNLVWKWFGVQENKVTVIRLESDRMPRYSVAIIC